MGSGDVLIGYDEAREGRLAAAEDPQGQKTGRSPDCFHRVRKKQVGAGVQSRVSKETKTGRWGGGLLRHQ